MAAPAPLVSIPEAPAPDGRAEWFAGARGVQLRAALFPAAAPRGSVVLSPGRTEPLEKYFEVVRDLTGRGLTVLVHDWRGQGASDRLLPDRIAGHAEGVDDFLEDYDALLARFGDQLPRPWIAMGHSMGGCLTLLAVEDGRRFDAAALSAPMLCIRMPGAQRIAEFAAWLNVKLGRAGQFVPGRISDPFEDIFDANRLTHDPVRYRRFLAQLRASPDLALGAPTWGWLHFGLQATRRACDPQRLQAINIPVLIAAAGDDRIVDSRVAKYVAERLAKGRYVEVEGAYHEILIETDARRAVFWSAFDDLLAEVL